MLEEKHSSKPKNKPSTGRKKTAESSVAPTSTHSKEKQSRRPKQKNKRESQIQKKCRGVRKLCMEPDQIQQNLVPTNSKKKSRSNNIRRKDHLKVPVQSPPLSVKSKDEHTLSKVQARVKAVRKTKHHQESVHRNCRHQLRSTTPTPANSRPQLPRKPAWHHSHLISVSEQQSVELTCMLTQSVVVRWIYT
jgi:hypothetical protein